jgi:uncharacterized surface protein with fasciclin (FAS1) repeats
MTNKMPIIQTLCRTLSAAILLLAMTTGCKKDQPATNQKQAASTKTLYQLIREDSSEFSILKTILSKTRVGDTLSHFSDTLRDTGMYTLFAPTDTFFIQAGITRDSIQRIRIDNLASMAKYYVSQGRWPASSFPDGVEMQVLQLGNALDQKHLSRYAFLTHHKANNQYYINGIPLLQYDIPAVNGVLHKIGGVIEHSSLDIATTVALDPRFAYDSLLTDPSWQSAGDTTPKTIFFPTKSATATALQFPVYDWMGNVIATTYGIATLQMVPNMVLFDPDFYDLNQHLVPSANHDAWVYSSPNDLVGSYNPNAYKLPVNFQFILNPGPAIRGPAVYSTPGNILRSPTIVATNGVIHFIDQAFWPYHGN